MKIKVLSKKAYKGYEISIAYKSDYYYRLEKQITDNGINISFVKTKYNKTFVKDNHTELFKDWWVSPKVYGLFDEDKLIGVIETSKENWNNRLRVTNISVDPEYRRKGLAKKLMDRVKQLAKTNGNRAVILETQTSNSNAIAFYLSQGFVLGGYNECEYSNDDISNNEVRIEMVYYMQ